MRRRGSTVAAGALAVTSLTLGCADRSREADGIDRGTFVATYIDLRRAVIAGSLDDTVRDSILALHDVSEADLRDYVDRHATDPEVLSATWREVLDSIARRDSAVANAASGDRAEQDR